jgi:hypothetical protein
MYLEILFLAVVILAGVSAGLSGGQLAKVSVYISGMPNRQRERRPGCSLRAGRE